jgi:glucosylceramidase
VRVLCATTRDELEATAFLNPDGRIAVVVLNRSEEGIPFALKFDGGAALAQSPAHSIQTLLLAGRADD